MIATADSTPQGCVFGQPFIVQAQLNEAKLITQQDRPLKILITASCRRYPLRCVDNEPTADPKPAAVYRFEYRFDGNAFVSTRGAAPRSPRTTSA